MKYRDRSLFYKRILVIAIMAAMMGTVGWMIANPDHYFALRAILWGDVVERNDYMKLSGSILSPSATPQNQMVENNKFDHSLPNQLLQDALSKFQTTIRSCLGSYCMDERFTDADHNNDKIERIGILLPDKRIQWQHMIDQMKSFDNGKLSSKRNIIASTHVPAYGYGRNHGWSRIVRILDQIPLQAYQLVHDNMNKNEPDVSKSYEIQIRQLMRWHCRLNHVAAHTFMLTVYIKDLLDHPHAEFDRILSFMGIKATRDQVAELVQSHLDFLQKQWNAMSYSDLPSSLADIATITITNEMDISAGLSKWPCNSFLDLEKSYGALPHSRYFELSADCSDPFVKCSVPYDQKEQL